MHVRRILEIDNREFVLQRHGKIRYSLVYYIVMAIFLWMGVIMAEALNFVIHSKDSSYPDDWIHRIITKCDGGESSLNQNSIFINSAFVKSGLVSNIFGAYIGIIFDAIFFGGSPETINKGMPLWKGVLRILVALLIISPFGAMYFFISDNANVMTLFLVKSTLPGFFMTFIIFSVIKIVYKRLRLINL